MQKRMISVLNDHLLDRCDMKLFYGNAYEIEEKDDLLTAEVFQRLNNWGHHSGLRKDPLFRSKIKK